MTENAQDQSVVSITENWETIPVTYNVTLRPRYTPALDESGKPIKTKNGETRMQLLSYEIPVDLRQGTFDQWTELFTFYGRDPEEAFAELANAAQKQDQESKKGDLRTAVLAHAEDCGLKDKKINNADFLKALAEIPTVQKEQASFLERVRKNFIGAPRPKTQKEEKQKQVRAGANLKTLDADLYTAIQNATTPEEVNAAIAAYTAKQAEEAAS